MTSKELADIIAPDMQVILEENKEQFLASMPAVKRFIVKSQWGVIHDYVVPLLTLVAVKYCVGKYDTYVREHIGFLLKDWMNSTQNQEVKQFLGVLEGDDNEGVERVN